MNYLGKQIDNRTLLICEVNREVLKVKNRTEFLRLLEVYNYKAVWKRIDKLTDKLTHKQWTRLLEKNTSKALDRLEHIEKLTKSTKILDQVYSIKNFLIKVNFIQKNTNKHYLVDSENKNLWVNNTMTIF